MHLYMKLTCTVVHVYACSFTLLLFVLYIDQFLNITVE